MNLRGRAKSRRRDIASYRSFHQQCGYGRAPTTRIEANAVLPSESMEARRAVVRANPRRLETKTIMRLDGDSIAYFWALEQETAISHEILTSHWRDFADALTASWTWG